jgi:hypothetical protein
MSRNTQRPDDVVTLTDLSPRRPVVGGSDRRVFGSNTSQERAMAPKKSAKDLAAGKTVKGGKVMTNDNTTLVRAAKPKTRCCAGPSPRKICPRRRPSRAAESSTTTT